MHTYTRYGRFWERHTHTHTLLHAHMYTHTHKYSFLDPGLHLESLEDFWGALPFSMSVYSPTLSPPPVRLVLCGAAVRAEGWGNPRNRRLILGAVTRHPWGCVVLLKGDEGLAPLGQEAQDSESVCLLHQGTEMVHIGWPLEGQ